MADLGRTGYVVEATTGMKAMDEIIGIIENKIMKGTSKAQYAFFNACTGASTRF